MTGLIKSSGKFRSSCRIIRGLTDSANRGTGKAGRRGDRARSDGGPRPVRWVTAPGRRGGPRLVTLLNRVEGKTGWIWERRLGKELILLESDFRENFSGSENIVLLYFLRLAGWIILRRRVVATEAARTTVFAARAFACVATKVARTILRDVCAFDVVAPPVARTYGQGRGGLQIAGLGYNAKVGYLRL